MKINICDCIAQHRAASQRAKEKQQFLMKIRNGNVLLAPEWNQHVAGALEACQRDTAIVKVGDDPRSLWAIRT
jgi:hypothetical protein